MLIAITGISSHRFEDDFLNLRGNGRVQFSRRRRITTEARVHDDQWIVPGEWRRAGDHFVQNRSERINVRPRIAALSLDLLGRHVIWCPHRWLKAAERQSPSLV